MEKLIERYLARCEGSGLAPTTVEWYGRRLRHFAAVVDKEAGDVNAEDIEEYLDIDCANLMLSSKRVALTAISAFFSYLHQRGRISANPTSAVRLSRPVQKRPTYYLPEQAAALIGRGSNVRNRVLSAVLLRHGQRISSAVALRWADVDWSAATVRYPAVKKSRPITLPLDADTAKSLRAWRALNPESEWVFPGREGEHLQANSARFALRRHCKECGVPYRGCHEFRRTCVTTLLQADVPLHVVSREIAGHASVHTTVQHYAGAQDDNVAAAIRRLPY